MKIYIIGNVASGKTTLAKGMAKKINSEYFELDKVIWNDDEGIKRSKKEIENIFDKIILKDSWIIEDVGRNIFINGIKMADEVLFLDISNVVIYFRILKRWLKQKLFIEKSNYKPTFKGLIEMFRWANEFNKHEKLKTIEKNSNRYLILKRKDINRILKSSK